MASTDRTLQWLQQVAHAWKIRFLKFTMSILYMDIQLCDMFTTIVRSRKTKQTSHLPTWLVSVDFQQLQFLAFLSLTFSSLSFSKRKERVVNSCYIIAKYIASVPNCSQITPQWSHMVFVNDPDACTRHKTQRWRHIGSFFFLIKHIASISPWVISDINHNDCWKKKGHKGTGRQACHKYSCHLWQLLWATTEQIHVKVKCFFSKSLQQTHH